MIIRGPLLGFAHVPSLCTAELKLKAEMEQRSCRIQVKQQSCHVQNNVAAMVYTHCIDVESSKFTHVGVLHVCTLKKGLQNSEF